MPLTNKAGFNFNNSYTLLPSVFFKPVLSSTIPNAKAVLINHSLATQMGLQLQHLQDDELSNIFSGNLLPENAMPIAQAYAGHQFGHFNMLGDGRAILLGEHITPQGARLDIQLKGSGQTPYSRRGDGKATYYSMLREYLISEAMHYLGIPSSISLAVILTGENVYRETLQQGAVLTRVASSHIRVGSFEYISRFHLPHLNTLIDYVIERHYPHLQLSPNKAIALLQQVIEKQIDLIVHWMRVGFVHGVMNTDNMFISGETLDYGPCAFMNAYYPGTRFSAIDEQGRYAYGNQPPIAQWNLAVFASALLPAIHENNTTAIEMAQETINAFSNMYAQKWLQMMRCKLGLLNAEDEDEQLIQNLLAWMETNKADYTNTFLVLQESITATDEIYNSTDFTNWKAQWQKRLAKNNVAFAESKQLMLQNNPAFIARNHLVEAALHDVTQQNDFTKFNQLLAVLQQPYQQNNLFAHFQNVPNNIDNNYQTFCGT
jgi:serine/tyrosine/threonine adenylyltransferase